MRDRFLVPALMGFVFGIVPVVSAHPHEPHPVAPPEKGSISDTLAAGALPAGAKLAIVDGTHNPAAGKEILRVLSLKPNVRELKIYGAAKWPEDALAGLKDFKRLEVLRIYDDSSRRKPGFLLDIAKVKTLQTLQLYYSGD